RLETAKLESLARSGGGFYQTLTLDDRDIRLFSRSFDHAQKMADRDAKQADQWVEEGSWLLLVVLPIAAFAFRRGYLLILLCLTLPFPQAVQAWQWNDLWQTRDQQGYQAFQRGNYDRAAELFEDPAWKAASEYSAGRYQEALETLDKVDAKSTAYNKGNALARSGRFPEALDSYKRALELNPDDEDACANRDLIESFMKQQDPSQNQSSDRDNSSDKKGSSLQNQENTESKDSGTEETGQQTPKPDPSDRAEKPDKTVDAENKNDPTPGTEERSSQIAEDASSRTEPDTGSDQAIEGHNVSADQEGRRLADTEHPSEQELHQANEQWLRRIPDDPGGLLRRKFLYQYQNSNRSQRSDVEPW
ncbi:MAG: tetratricopeptide repeat protein, partial [Methylococcales bacterium]